MRDAHVLTGTDAARLLGEARDAQRRALWDDALERLGGCADWPQPYNEHALLLRAEVLTSRDPIAGLQELASHCDSFVSPDGRFGYLIASARAYMLACNFDSAQEMLDAAQLILDGPNDPRSPRLSYYRARLQWSRHEYNPQSEYLAHALRDTDPAVRFLAINLRAWMYAGLEDYHSQLQDLLETLRLFEEYGYQCDLAIVARSLQATLGLAWEVGDDAAMHAGEAVFEKIAWTQDIAVNRFQCLRALAWHAFLQGDPARAQWLFKDSKDHAPTPAWKVMSHVDRAYVARMNLNEAWATEELYQAHAIARSVEWQATREEERMALLTLGLLFAPIDAGHAQRYVSTFVRLGTDSLNPYLEASHESRRSVAFEKYATGRVQAMLGNTNLAIRCLEASYEIFSQIGHEYRAALSAAALHDLTKQPKWLDMARAHASKFPKSALYERLHDTMETPAGALFEGLTATQRQIATAYCQGLDADQLSRKFSRSTFTIEKQIEAIYVALNVHTRSELREALQRRGVV